MSPNIDDNNTDRNIRESIDKKESKLATLKVAEAEQRDVGRKIARVVAIAITIMIAIFTFFHLL